MRASCLTQAIVLRCWPYGESDRIVSFFTQEYGKVTGIAKGAMRSRKRFVNTLQPFSLVKLCFRDRPAGQLNFIYACDLIRPFKNLTSSLEKITHASYLVELIDGLTGERDENRSLFEHLKEGLVFLEEMGTSLPFLTFFELRLLKLSGYQPALEHCRRCGRSWAAAYQAEWRFSPRDGGILCGPCSALKKEVIPLSSQAIRMLADLQRASGVIELQSVFPVSALKEGHSVLLRFIQFHMNRELKSIRFLEAF